LLQLLWRGRAARRHGLLLFESLGLSFVAAAADGRQSEKASAEGSESFKTFHVRWEHRSVLFFENGAKED
jgi:hypothetical protein